MSENKDISSTTSKSLLPEDVIAILYKNTSDSFECGWLNLRSKGINDSMMPELCKLVVKLGDKVNIFDLETNQITSDGASVLFDTLKTNNSSLKAIYLRNNKQVDDKCMKSLGEYIKSNKSIESIVLDNTSVSDAGIEILAPYLDDNATLKYLGLNVNKGIRDTSISLLMKMIESSCIEHVGIYDTLITQKNTIYAVSACKGIKNSSNTLDLSFKQLNDDNLMKICNAMRKYGINKLKTICLEGNRITSKGASVLFDTLKECNSVVSMMNLSYNQLDDGCIKQLGEYIQYNEYFEDLRFVGNGYITDKSVEILLEYLIGNVRLRELDLSSNRGITDASAPHLIEIATKSCITGLYISETSVSDEKQVEIENASLIPIDQREIPIKSNTKSAAKIQSSFASAST